MQIRENEPFAGVLVNAVELSVTLTLAVMPDPAVIAISWPPLTAPATHDAPVVKKLLVKLTVTSPVESNAQVLMPLPLRLIVQELAAMVNTPWAIFGLPLLVRQATPFTKHPAMLSVPDPLSPPVGEPTVTPASVNISAAAVLELPA